ncbi:uncharacterized protein B0I36DRAFT_322402 [Microdochium trichocladiopsis]|uniref:Uncharacterized protein n=1 Tax=Microdochium trichocladiopsis TaxID=1682393 RepID=A0A9P8Y8J4_9PEZI|nr:uncharacterized protein B0I36DRAFT_322402 [Microdochium trichocladiopsis]KAH7030764.1 hypothetical protein B0I36DRAFT_322402 [Microdochium trichocladiopsis]
MHVALQRPLQTGNGMCCRSGQALSLLTNRHGCVLAGRGRRRNWNATLPCARLAIFTKLPSRPFAPARSRKVRRSAMHPLRGHPPRWLHQISRCRPVSASNSSSRQLSQHGMDHTHRRSSSSPCRHHAPPASVKVRGGAFDRSSTHSTTSAKSIMMPLRV